MRAPGTRRTVADSGYRVGHLERQFPAVACAPWSFADPTSRAATARSSLRYRPNTAPRPDVRDCAARSGTLAPRRERGELVFWRAHGYTHRGRLPRQDLQPAFLRVPLNV